DPRVPAGEGDEGVDLGTPRRLRVDGGDVRARQHRAREARGDAGVDQIVDDEEACAVAFERLEYSGLAGGVVVAIGDDADRLDEADVELARDDRRRYEPSASDADDAAEGPHLREPPGEGARIAVQLRPVYGKSLPRMRGQGPHSARRGEPRSIARKCEPLRPRFRRPPCF